MAPAPEIFEVDFTTGPAWALHQRDVGRLDEAYDWASLDPARYPPLLVERARLGWTENAFNEFCTAAAMGQLIAAMGQARVPLDLWSLACRFPVEELVHVELCARLAMRLGGGAPIAYDPESLRIDIDDSSTPLERCNELVVRLLCVGEALSLPLLTGCMRSATHPLVRAVLTHIVRDEAMHGRLGFLYLDWIGDELSLAERDRLGRAAADTIAHHAPIWEKLRSRTVDGITSEGFALADVRALGWMESSEYARLARAELDESVRGPLAHYGIAVPRAWR
jgi:hypothetical protein